jgi:hypothetical protein
VKDSLGFAMDSKLIRGMETAYIFGLPHQQVKHEERHLKVSGGFHQS